MKFGFAKIDNVVIITAKTKYLNLSDEKNLMVKKTLSSANGCTVNSVTLCQTDGEPAPI